MQCFVGLSCRISDHADLNRLACLPDRECERAIRQCNVIGASRRRPSTRVRVLDSDDLRIRLAQRHRERQRGRCPGIHLDCGGGGNRDRRIGSGWLARHVIIDDRADSSRSLDDSIGRLAERHLNRLVSLFLRVTHHYDVDGLTRHTGGECQHTRRQRDIILARSRAAQP